MPATKPPFAYYGGKTKNAERIADLLPAHQHYVEPFAGSLAVLLAKSRAEMETINDIDQDLMTFWRVLREQPDELRLMLDLTPHSRAEHQAAYDLEGSPDDLERARRVWVLLSQSRGSTLRRTGWRFYRNPGGSTYSMPEYLNAYSLRVPAAAERLRGVSLECRDALDVIRDFGQHPGCLIYADPPYLGSTRSANYRHEMTSDDDHTVLAAALRACEASVVISGYPSALYDDLYDGWYRHRFGAWTGNGIRDGERVEVLWSNRPLGEPSLFDEEAP